LSNYAFAKIFYGVKDEESTIFPHAAFPSVLKGIKTINSSYLTRGLPEYFFSNYFKINNYVLIKYFLMIFKLLNKGFGNLAVTSLKGALFESKNKGEVLLNALSKKKN